MGEGEKKPGEKDEPDYWTMGESEKKLGEKDEPNDAILEAAVDETNRKAEEVKKNPDS